MVINFWWGATSEEKRIHWRKWKLLCRPKSEGGMGFRDISSFNQALLAKQAWSILNNPQSLAAQIYKSKYYPLGNFLDALGNNPSYVWRSILWGWDLLQKGLRWRISTGLNVRVFKDPWLMRPKLFRPITIPNNIQSQLKVVDLLNIHGDWNWPTVESLIWEVDCIEVRKLPLGSGSDQDKLIWHYSPKGDYTVKSGYFLALMGVKSSSSGIRCGLSSGLKKMWNLRVPNKVMIHMWRCIFNALPVKTNLDARGIMVDPFCPICISNPEDITHSFWSCHLVHQHWKMSSIWPMMSVFQLGSFTYLFCHIIVHGNGDDLGVFVSLCWSLWVACNRLVFNGSLEKPVDVLARADCMLSSYRIFTHDQCYPIPIPALSPHWKPLSFVSLKVNVDAAVLPSKDFFGIDIVGRDSNGIVQFLERRCFRGSFTPHFAEILALKLGVEKALSSGWSCWEIETDALNVIRAIQNPGPFSMEEPFLEAIRRHCTLAPTSTIAHCPRSTNKVAH